MPVLTLDSLAKKVTELEKKLTASEKKADQAAKVGADLSTKVTALTTKVAALEKQNIDKRLSLLEAKVRALADNMTDSRSIDRFMNTIEREQTDQAKSFKRMQELQKQAEAARLKETEKIRADIIKEAQKGQKMAKKIGEAAMLEGRLRQLEALVQTALAQSAAALKK